MTMSGQTDDKTGGFLKQVQSFGPDGSFGGWHIGGIEVPKKKGLDFSEPMTVALVGGGVLIFGAVLLAAVKVAGGK